MDQTNTTQPEAFAGTSEDTELFAPTEEQAVPNPFAIPPSWLETWAADKAAKEAAQEAQEEAEDEKEDASSKDTKTDGIIASLSSGIPKFLQDAKAAVHKATADKKSSGISENIQGAVTNLTGQLGQAGASAGQQVGAGAGQGLLSSIQAGIPGAISQLSQAAQAELGPLVGAAQQAATPAVQQVVAGAVEAAKPGVADLAHTAGASAVAGAKGETPAGIFGLSPTTLVLGGVGVLGALGLGAYLLSSDSPKFVFAPPGSSPGAKTLAVRLEDEGSGLGKGVAIVGGAAAVALLAGYFMKHGGFNADKTAGGPAVASLIMRSSPMHPFTLADNLGMSHELLHLDPTAILGPSPSQKDHDAFFSAYPIGHKAGSDNCDAGRLNKQGIVYMKDPSKSQTWDNGWLKGYYDGWLTEGCTAGIKKTASGPSSGGASLAQIQGVLLPWQQIAFAKRLASYPNFGSDIAEVIRVLAITPAQLTKAKGVPVATTAAIDPSTLAGGGQASTASQTLDATPSDDS